MTPSNMMRMIPGAIPMLASTDGRDKIPKDTVSANITSSY